MSNKKLILINIIQKQGLKNKNVDLEFSNSDTNLLGNIIYL
jgi:hypothetical protein